MKVEASIPISPPLVFGIWNFNPHLIVEEWWVVLNLDTIWIDLIFEKSYFFLRFPKSSINYGCVPFVYFSSRKAHLEILIVFGSGKGFCDTTKGVPTCPLWLERLVDLLLMSRPASPPRLTSATSTAASCFTCNHQYFQSQSEFLWRLLDLPTGPSAGLRGFIFEILARQRARDSSEVNVAVRKGEEREEEVVEKAR